MWFRFGDLVAIFRFLCRFVYQEVFFQCNTQKLSNWLPCYSVLSIRMIFFSLIHKNLDYFLLKKEICLSAKSNDALYTINFQIMDISKNLLLVLLLTCIESCLFLSIALFFYVLIENSQISAVSRR